jgi:hypothetical protein
MGSSQTKGGEINKIFIRIMTMFPDAADIFAEGANVLVCLPDESVYSLKAFLYFLGKPGDFC